MSDLVHAFPPGFLWGAATSAHQVEGGNRANDWWRFEQAGGHVADGAVSGDACRHFERFDEDFALAQADGHNAHRLSLEWSRIEPAPGRFDDAALAHYRAVLAALRRRGLEPIVTLHHFTNPVWIADRGGWENPETIERFASFVRVCARAYADLVDWWCTVNEPEVYAFRAYSQGVWPPGRRDASAALVVIANMLEAHARAARVLRDEDRADADGDGHATRVGFAKHYVILEPDRPWFPLDRALRHFEDAVFNHAILRAPATGRIDLSIPGARGVSRDVADLRDSVDYLGLNYYTRWKVRALAADPHVAARGVPLNDLGWEIYPSGIEQAARAAAALGRPVLVLENGVADAHDRVRPRALVESLVHLAGTIAAGVPVGGYLHWSLLDNFEWAEGYRGRFGLYRIDFADPRLERRRTRSADLFARIARLNGIGRPELAAADLT
jgi:beta-glucosidase